MVEDRTTDGKRIAQLLASELSGLENEILGRLSVVDAERDAEPSPGGTFAYGIAFDDDRIADVFIHETTARLEVTVDDELPDKPVPANGNTDGLDVETAADGLSVHVEYGAAVKRTVDLLVTLVDEQEGSE